MRATTAHRALERMADGTCIREWAWMTDKCRRMMNRRGGYITIEISQRRGTTRKEREAQKHEGGSYVTKRGWRILVLEQGVPSPWDVGPPDSVCFSSPKQAIASSEPNFWTHSLQIYCNRFGPKTMTLQLYLWKY